MPKLVLGFLAVEENSKWLPQEGGAGLEQRDLIMPVTGEKKGGRRIGKEWSPHLLCSHPSCHSPSEVGRPSTEKNAQWSLDHLAAIFTWLLLSITSVQSLICPTFFFGELWIISIKSSWNICMSRAQLQATMPSAGSLKAPNGTPKTNAAHSMILCVWCLAEQLPSAVSHSEGIVFLHWAVSVLR